MSVQSLNKCVVLHRVMKKQEYSFKKYVPTFRHVALFCIKHPALLEIKFFGEPLTFFFFIFLPLTYLWLCFKIVDLEIVYSEAFKSAIYM